MENSLRTGPENAVIPRHPSDAARIVLDRQFCDMFWDLCIRMDRALLPPELHEGSLRSTLGPG